MADTVTIRQGDSYTWFVGHAIDGVDQMVNAGYTCRFKVVGTAIDRPVTTFDTIPAYLNKRFVVSLTLAESAVIAAGSYIFAYELENTAAQFRQEDQGILIVETQAIGGSADPAAQTEVERLNEELSEIRAARRAFLTGGSVKQAWSGRYGNRMTYDNPTLQDFDNAILGCQRDIEAAMNAAEGRPRRGSIGVLWG